MKAEPELKAAENTGAPVFQVSEGEIGLYGLRRMFAEMRLTTLLRLYRFASLALSAVLFLWTPGGYSLYGKLSLIAPVLVTAVLLTFLYERFRDNGRVVCLLAVLEITGLSVLLSFTGGYSGPFLWYALNPFIVASAFLSFSLAWLTLILLFAGIFGVEWYLSAGSTVHLGSLIGSYYPILNLVVIAVIIHLYTRMHLTMSERLMESGRQQKELMAVQESLSFNYQVFKGLSNFQREAACYKNRNEIYSTLVDTLMHLFPFRQASVLIPPADFVPGAGREDSSSFKVIGSDQEKAGSAAALIHRELENRWEELNRLEAKKVLISENRRWIALPLRGINRQITAVFVGQIKPKTNPLSFAENLSLFIRFTEQTTEWLNMFKQRELVLQHISSIYKAVETASSQNDPRMVIDLFASYARSLTDCDKAIFWMESISREDEEDNENGPLYSIKGRRDLFPEEEWQEELLHAWASIREHQSPVLLDLNQANSKSAQLIGVPVKTGSQCLGLLAGVKSNSTYRSEEIVQILTVLADLSAIAVQRARVDMFAEKLLVVEEQRRIANEIHDSISQNLFSIVYSIDALSKEAGRTLDELQKGTLHDIKNLSAETAHELRALIYRLNPSKDANEIFVQEILSYLDKMSRMNEIEISHNISGSTEYLNPAICKSLYRIIKESTGNALRHSNCTRIMVELDVTPFRSLLKVSDNGHGFDIQNSLDLYSSGNRLGLVNMRELALSLQGNLTIDSTPGLGTDVTCIIPTTPVSVE